MTITTWDPPEHGWAAPELLSVRARVNFERRAARVELVGDLCAFTSPVLRDRLAQLACDGITSVVIDMIDLRFCTSHGIEVLIAARDGMRAREGDLRIEHATGVVRRVLDLVGLAHDQPR